MENLNEIINIDSNAEFHQFQRGDVLQRAGSNNYKAFYVKKGLLRSYAIDSKGKEHIFVFAPEGWLIADIESQEFDQPAKLFVECIESSEVLIFDRRLLTESNLSTDQLKRNANLMARRIAVLQSRVIMLMSASAKERYEHFLETYPNLPNRVSQRMIASYLGITPEALSKIRGEIAHQNNSNTFLNLG